MDLSGLADLMQRAESVFPVFSIRFPFHIAYDVIIRLASSWILEDSAGELAAVFSSSFGAALRSMYGADPEFLAACRHLWEETAPFALALLPLMLLLSVFGTFRYGAGSSALTLVKARELAFGTILNAGLAAYSFLLFTKVLSLSSALGRQMLSISGISAADDFTSAAKRIFLPAMLTDVDGSSEALLVVLMFLRLFLTLILFISIVLAAVSTRIGILLLFGISPVCFVLSVYEEFEWIRDSWIRAFTGFILTPVFDGILLALIMLNNERYVSPMKMGDVFRTLCTSIGIGCMIVMLHSEVIAKIFDALIADLKKAGRAAKTAAQALGQIWLAVSSGGASAAAAAGKAAASSAHRLADVPEKDPARHQTAGGRRIQEMKARNALRYGMTAEENRRAGSAVRQVLRAMDEISREEYGMNLNAAVRKGMHPPVPLRRYLDRRGGAAGILAAGLMDHAGRRFHPGNTDGDSENSRQGFGREASPDPGTEYRNPDAGKQDTFRNLYEIAVLGMDGTLDGGTQDDIYRLMRDAFAGKKAGGFDMAFRNSGGMRRDA